MTDEVQISVEDALEHLRPISERYNAACAHMCAYADIFEELSAGAMKAAFIRDPALFCVRALFHERVDHLRDELEGEQQDVENGPVSKALALLEAAAVENDQQRRW